MPARHISWKETKKIIDVFLETSFEGGRHEIRVNKINNI
jgi:ribose 5-phosphate isomerase B